MSEFPLSVDLRPHLERWGLPPRRQGKRGTCSVFAVTGALEYALALRRRRGTRLSVEFLNWAAHRAANRSADGGFFSELWDGFEQYGICPEADLPYRDAYDEALQPPPAAVDSADKLRTAGLHLHWIKPWNLATGLTGEQLAEIRRALVSGFPVCGGFRWPHEPRWEHGVLRMCGPDAVYDGHSVLLVGYETDPNQPGGGIFLLRNSGSDGPDGAMPYAYAAEYMNDACWIASAGQE